MVDKDNLMQQLIERVIIIFISPLRRFSIAYKLPVENLFRRILLRSHMYLNSDIGTISSPCLRL